MLYAVTTYFLMTTGAKGVVVLGATSLAMLGVSMIARKQTH